MKKSIYTLLALLSPIFLQADLIDIVVFSYNRPMQLYAQLESLEKHVEGYNNIHVIYRHEEDFTKGYEIVKKDFPLIRYHKQNSKKDVAFKEFKPLVMDLLFGENTKDVPFVIFSTDDLTVTAHIDLQADLLLLKSRHAKGFYYRLGRNITECYAVNAYSGTPPLIEVGNETLEWSFSKGLFDWNYPNTVDFTLYEKAPLKALFSSLNFHHPNSFEGTWATEKVFGTGLCKTESKIVNIPMNIVSDYNNRQGYIFTDKELYYRFIEGEKIDLTSIECVKNRAPHWEITPTFMLRKDYN